MNEIIVGIDFSEASKNALNHAISIAESFNSKLILLLVEDKMTYSQLNANPGESSKEAIERKLSEWKELCTKVIKEENIEVIIKKGVQYKIITQIANERNVNMVVIGTHSVNGLKRLFTSSNAEHIISDVKCPVISIRENRGVERALKTIVVPIDSTLDTRQKIPIATKLASTYNAEIHLLGLFFSDIQSIKKRVKSYVDQSATYLKKHNVDYKIEYTDSKNGAKTVMNYAIEVNAGLIATMIETEKLSSDLWLGSHGQQLVNSSPIPILSISNKELIKARPGM